MSKKSLRKPPSAKKAMEAVRTLLEYIGEDPDREGLVDTPKRVIQAYGEYFAGYQEKPKKILSTTFNEVGGYDEMIVLRDIQFHSHCEHHMAPFYGRAHVAYIPNKKVVGLSKMARLVDVFAKRLQVQERMTAEIADSMEKILKPKGVAVVVEGEHSCMARRGVKKCGARMQTSKLTGLFRKDEKTRQEFLNLIAKP